MNNLSSQVKVPREFFAKSKLEYSDWRLAFFRELIQNCYDAGSTEIIFEIVALTPERMRISCVDNGIGMDQDTLQNVLLALGGSKKPDGAIGGFGYAKSLLFFAHHRYMVRTNKWLVLGKGGDYEMKEQPAFVKGTTVGVEIDNEGYSVNDFCEKLRRYASHLSLERPLRITLNNEEVNTQFSDFEYSVRTALGDFSFREVENSMSQVVVAVRGLPMFIQRVWSSASVGFNGLLELEGESFDLLTANRDALKGEHSDMLNRILQRMIEDRHQFKGGTTLDITLNFNDPVALKAALEGMSEQQALLFMQQAESLEESLRYMNNPLFPRNFNLRLQNTVGRAGKDREDATISVSTILQTLGKAWVQALSHAWKRVVYTTLATEHGQKIGVEYYRDDKTKIVKDIHLEDFDRGAFYANGTRISTGFIFAKDTEGLNVKPNNGSDIMILCNPTTFDKKFLVGDLLDLAIHELSHLCVSGHGEVFVDVDMKFRRSFRRLMNEGELKLTVKAAIANHKTNLTETE